MGLALAGAGAASADDGKTLHHVVGGTAKFVEHTVADAGTNVHQIVGCGATKAVDLFGGHPGTPLGGALPTAVSHPINTRSLQQIQSLENKDSSLSEIIQQSGIDNNNAVAALEELQQEQKILIKANTLAEGIQNGTIPNTQEEQVIVDIAQAQALEAEAHARLRNNIN